MSSERIRFDVFEIDVSALEVTRDGQRLALAPAAVRVLIYLAKHAGSLVTREELYSRLWPDGGVDRERLLNTYIRQIRAALGERSGDDQFIRTYPRRGYRFLPALLERTPRAPVTETPRGFRWGRRWTLAGATGLVLIALLIVATFKSDPGPLSPGDDANALEGEARIAFLTGRELLGQPMPSVRATAVPYFQTVTRLRPDFAPAFTGLAESFVWTGQFGPAAEAARSAVRLGSRDPRASMALGTALLAGEWAWAEAETELRRAAESAESDPAPHLALAFLLVSSGRNADARLHLDHARRLSPVAPDLTGDLGTLYGWVGDHETALELCRRTTRIEPRASWGYACELEAGRALGLADVVAEAAASLVRLAGGSPNEVLAPATDTQGRIAALRRFQLMHVGDFSHFGRAGLWLELGDADQALSELERAAEAREMGFVALLGAPQFRPLEGRDRFRRLARRLFGGEPPQTARATSS